MLKINTVNRHEHVRPIFDALNLVTNVQDTHHIPPFHIAYKDKLIGYIDIFDGFAMEKFNRTVKNRIRDPKIIFKFHTYANFDYEDRYPDLYDKIVTCGIYRWYKPHEKVDMPVNRNIDVMAQMRTENSGTRLLLKQGKPVQPWVHARKEIIKQAEIMARQGYNTRYGWSAYKKYMEMLKDTELAFIWTASAYLGWKIGEFLQHGVIMISPIMDYVFPFRDDVHLYAGEHYIKCNTPELYGDVARSALTNPKMLQEIRANIFELWKEKLNPYSTGKWWLRKIGEVV